jgi:hypothetical protein
MIPSTIPITMNRLFIAPMINWLDKKQYKNWKKLGTML